MLGVTGPVIIAKRVSAYLRHWEKKRAIRSMARPRQSPHVGGGAPTHKPRLACRWMDLARAIAGTYNTSANAPVADDELEMVSRRYGPEEIAEERHRVARARAEIANRERH
jgi:hypothetical protein